MIAGMDTLDLAGRTVSIERARQDDVPGIVALLSDDMLGRDRESADLGPYRAAFDRIDADPNQLLVVGRDEHGALIATLQLTLMPSLSRGGATRLQIESVRVAEHARGGGLGAALFAWAHDWGREHGASLAQLTSDAAREDAHRFYDRIGYSASHVGYKLPL